VITVPLIAEADRADVETFLTRLLRLDPTAVVRLRPARSAASAQLWAMLPFRVLVTRPLSVLAETDMTVSAADLLAKLGSDAGLARRDAAWLWPLPPSRTRVVEAIPAAEVVRLAAAASRTLRTAAAEGVAGRAVGERVVRDALLDHVSIVVTTDDGERIDVPQRVVQAVVRMGFLGKVTHGDDLATNTAGSRSVTVRLAIGWIGLDALHGSAWYRPISPLRLG
jgi:hypothetical protein